MYKYTEIVYKINNEEEYLEVKKFLNENGYNLSPQDNYYSPIYLYITIKDDKYVTYAQWSARETNPDYKILDDIDYWNNEDKDTNIERFIYSKDTINQFKMMIKEGRKVPDYSSNIGRIVEAQEHYPYRFKTEQELLDEFGSNWRSYILVGWNYQMNYLFGKEYPFHIKHTNDYLSDFPDEYSWSISSDMLIKNELLSPHYRSNKGRIVESLDNLQNKYVAYYIKSQEERLDITEYLYSQGFIWDDQSNTPPRMMFHENSYVIFAIFSIRGKYLAICSGSRDYIQRYVYDDDKIYKNKLFDESTKKIFKNLIEFGMEKIVPDYSSNKNRIVEIMSSEKYNKKYFIIKCNMGNFAPIQKFLIDEQGYIWKNTGAKIIHTAELDLYNRYYIIINVEEKTLSYKISNKGSKYVIDYIKKKFGNNNVYSQMFDGKTYNAFKLLIKNKLYKLQETIEIKENVSVDKFNVFNRNSLEDLTTLYAFDMDDTLVYGERFASYVKYLIKEYLTPEDMLMQEIEKIGITLDKLKYENGRIFFEDDSDIIIPLKSSWVKKKERIYLKQPEQFFLSDWSLPTNTNDRIVNLYKNATNKAIITARKDLMMKRTEIALTDLGIDMPNFGLHMYPSIERIFKSRWKIDIILDLCKDNNFKTVHYFDDNIKLLKKMKKYFEIKKSNINIYFYKVNKNNYREI